jgi:hypothetical protein
VSSTPSVHAACCACSGPLLARLRPVSFLGRARQLCPSISDLDFLSDFEGIVDLNPRYRTVLSMRVWRPKVCPRPFRADGRDIPDPVCSAETLLLRWPKPVTRGVANAPIASPGSVARGPAVLGCVALRLMRGSAHGLAQQAVERGKGCRLVGGVVGIDFRERERAEGRCLGENLQGSGQRIDLKAGLSAHVLGNGKAGVLKHVGIDMNEELVEGARPVDSALCAPCRFGLHIP